MSQISEFIFAMGINISLVLAFLAGFYYGKADGIKHMRKLLKRK